MFGFVFLSNHSILVTFIENSFVGWGLQRWEEGGGEVQVGAAPRSQRSRDLQPTPSERPSLSSPSRSEDLEGR